MVIPTRGKPMRGRCSGRGRKDTSSAKLTRAPPPALPDTPEASDPDTDVDQLLNSDTESNAHSEPEKELPTQAEEQKSDSDVDDPEPMKSEPIIKPFRSRSKLVDVVPEKTHHLCVMAKISPLDSSTSRSRCNEKNPQNIQTKDAITHYYQHYLKRKIWDKALPPCDVSSNIEWFQCKLCDMKFKVKLNEDPAPYRCSFLYHWATYHGKIIDAMQEDREVEMTMVLEILAKSDTKMKEFISNGTDKEFDEEPASIRRYCDWKVVTNLNSLNNKGASPGPGRPSTIQSMAATTASSSGTPVVRQINYRGGDGQFFRCHKCSQMDQNKEAMTLKLHMYLHYIDFWKDLELPKGELTAKCKECNRPQTAGNAAALRNSMICHLALRHNELKEAAEPDKDEFDPGLFDMLFNGGAPMKPSQNSEGVKKPTAISNSSIIQQGKQQGKSKQQPVIAKKSQPEKVTPTKSKAGRKRKEENVKIPNQPYIRKRIKQDLSNIDFESDSDEDEDWERTVKSKRSLPASKRKKALNTFENFDSESD